jgi:hypothetical protein
MIKVNNTKSLITRYRIQYVFIVVVFLLNSCAANHAAQIIKEENISEVIIHALDYNDKGLPVVGTLLSKRPNKQGEHFTIAHLNQGRLVSSYDIAVVSGKLGYTKPFKTVYEWTGKGFTIFPSAHIDTNTKVTTFTNEDIKHDDLTKVVVGIYVAPLAITTVGGFVVGVVDGIKQTAVELSKVVMDEEQLITYTVFDYDEHNRLHRMRMFTQDRSTILTSTIFEYEGLETVPARSMVESPIEKKVYQVGMPSWMEHWDNK